MKILVLGNSNIFQKKVYPGISKIKKINIEIATKRRKKINLNVKKIYNSYNSYLKFLCKTFEEVHRITKEGRFLILNTSPIIIARIA